MKPPVKDRDTVPWISPAEIPAVKIMLSAWRKLRKDKKKMKDLNDYVFQFDDIPDTLIESSSHTAARNMVILTLAEAVVFKETHDGRPGSKTTKK